MTIAQEFSLALTNYRAEEDSFKPLLEKFEELKEIIQSNFKMKQKHYKWYGAVTWEVLPAINVSIEDKIAHSSGKYLFIRINNNGYVMGLGEIGDLKDRLYFIEGRNINKSKDKQVVYITSHMFGTCDFCLEDKITNVQLFSYLIKIYKQYLIPQ